MIFKNIKIFEKFQLFLKFLKNWQKMAIFQKKLKFFKNFDIFENHIFCSKIKNFGRILLPGVWKNLYFFIAFYLWALEISNSLLTIKFAVLNIFFAIIWLRSWQFSKEVGQLQKNVGQRFENHLNISGFVFY